MNTIDFLNRNRGIGVELLEKYVSMSLGLLSLVLLINTLSQRCLKTFKMSQNPYAKETFCRLQICCFQNINTMDKSYNQEIKI